MAIEIVDFPIKNGDFQQLCKRLPEGNGSLVDATVTNLVPRFLSQPVATDTDIYASTLKNKKYFIDFYSIFTTNQILDHSKSLMYVGKPQFPLYLMILRLCIWPGLADSDQEVLGLTQMSPNGFCVDPEALH